MKSDDLKKLPLLFEIFPNFPSIRVMALVDQGIDVVQKVANFLKERDYELDVMVRCDIFQKELESHLQNPSLYLKIRALDYHDKQYTYQGRQYDAVLVHVDFDAIWDERYFFERIYAVMKNAAGIIVLIPKRSPIAEGMEERLEGYNFVAINRIDIFEEYEIFYAKKLHGWDGAR